MSNARGRGTTLFAGGNSPLRSEPVGANAGNLQLAATLIDSLDVLHILGMASEFKEARDWIDDAFHFEVDKFVSLFEITIRVLGGSVPCASTVPCALYIALCLNPPPRPPSFSPTSDGEVPVPLCAPSSPRSLFLFASRMQQSSSQLRTTPHSRHPDVHPC